MRRTAPALALLTVLALAGCGDDSSDATATDDAPTDGASCTYDDSGQPAAKEVDPPPTTATDDGTVDATLATSVGDLSFTLDAAAAPCTVNSFVSLAEQGYFDDTTCHRLTTPQSGISVLQCGDPSATGSGGPGYSFDDELTGQETYPAGTLAMANAGPNTNGSQFFIVYGDTPLPADYTVFGTVDDDSVAIVEKVARKGTSTGGPDGPPAEAVDIESVTIG